MTAVCLCRCKMPAPHFATKRVRVQCNGEGVAAQRAGWSISQQRALACCCVLLTAGHIGLRTPVATVLFAGMFRVCLLCYCLLQGAAGVDDEDGTGLTPLHTAAELGAASLAELLLEKGADLNHAGTLPATSCCARGLALQSPAELH